MILYQICKLYKPFSSVQFIKAAKQSEINITVLTSSTTVLAFSIGGIVSEQKRLTSLIPVQDPLAVLLLNNQLFITGLEDKK